MTSQQINEQRLKVFADMRAMHEKVNEDDRTEFTPEEQEKYDKFRAEEKKLLKKRDELAHLEASEKELATPTRAGIKPEMGVEMTATQLRAQPEYDKAFTALLRSGFQATPEINATLQKAVTTQGGYLVPIEFETQLVAKMYDANLMRQLGKVTRTTSQVDIPMNGNLPTFNWIAELGAYGSTDLSFAQNTLGAFKLGGVITVSEELMQDAFLDVAGEISDQAALAAGFAEEAAFILGSGSGQPTGWVTTCLAATSSGASASGVASVGMTTASNSTVNSVDMINLFYTLARPYRKNASFIVADSVVSKLRQEKSTTGQYLWQPSLVASAPDVYLNKPIYTSDFLAALAPSSVSAAFGDFSYYRIVDRVGWSMQKLEELYALNGMVGFRMWERTDGKLLRPEAVSLLTTHA